jgi:hypothetical protein
LIFIYILTHINKDLNYYYFKKKYKIVILINGDKKTTPQEFIEKFRELKLYDCKRQDLPILEKWVKLKETLYGDKN